MAKKVSPYIQAHLEWLGFVQPTGLVVSPTALDRCGATLPRNDRASQERLKALVFGDTKEPSPEDSPRQPDFDEFSRRLLNWSWNPKFYAGTEQTPIPEELRHRLEDYEETLAPDYAVADRDPIEDAPSWQLLVRELPPGQDLDVPVRDGGTYEASPHARHERLLRATRVPAGLLYNGETIRLISAPYGESSGWIDFRVAEMVQSAGRPVCAALVLVLSEQRLLAGQSSGRLPALLRESRKYQNEVSEKLATQVLHALYELLRGLEAADARSKGALLRGVRDEHPEQVYHALLTVLLRLVFLLYAEEREMLPKDGPFLNDYSLVGLHRRLTEDAARYPDTMNQRFGAWGQLIVLFRMVYDGAKSGRLQMPSRHGTLFDPDRYPFLEGRTSVGVRQEGELLEYPAVPDGTIQRVLENLLVLDGERLSYRALDVEQIGSVYETMMGFRIETATGPSVAIRAAKKGGAPTTIDLEQLGSIEPKKRAKWLRDRTGKDVGKMKTVATPLRAASTLEELHSALDRVLDKDATPDLVPEGSLVLQPSEARRKSGSHYTPRELTEPIVRTTLRPILERLREEAGGTPTPDQILDLKVCDPAMGSGAFLVETCRQLAEELIESWRVHDARPDVPGDEDEVIHARRLVAQRCLYGVDRNPLAVDLAKVSLWLATLAREHAFTFLDHALRHGDSLVGLTNAQIAARDWSQVEPLDSPKYRELIAEVQGAMALRRQIREAGDEVSDWELRDLLDEAEYKVSRVRTYGDLVIEAFFSAAKAASRKAALERAWKLIGSGDVLPERARLDTLREADPPLAPFHWELEFPEVFDRTGPGFDAFVGNPPFAGKNTLGASNVDFYPHWLKEVHPGSHGNADVVAHMFRCAFDHLREGGCFGLIATNTIAQGDTRNTGLRWICEHGGSLYGARRRVKWPGQAAVVVSVVHGMRGRWQGECSLDGRSVGAITAYLFHRGGHGDPAKLEENEGQSFVGSYVLGMGFTFDDTDKKGVASSLADMERLLEKDPRNRDVIFPYIGGEEVNQSPTHAHHRYVINFGEMPLRREALDVKWADASLKRKRAMLRTGVVPLDYPDPVAADWPELLDVVEKKVRPERIKLTKNAIGRKRAQLWWRYGASAKSLYAAIDELDRVLAISQTSRTLAFAFLPVGLVYSHKLIVFPFERFSVFASMQCSAHGVWTRFFGSTMKDDAVYTPSDCFETYPFPVGYESSGCLERVGRDYYEFRAQLMVETDLGMTKTYNRFHDPEEDDPRIQRLRELHAAMDRAVLDAYGWSDIPTDCEFLLDYEVEEEVGKRRKKPWRYRWPDEVHDEVLARLLELNALRAAEEAEARSDRVSERLGLYD